MGNGKNCSSVNTSLLFHWPSQNGTKSNSKCNWALAGHLHLQELHQTRRQRRANLIISSWRSLAVHVVTLSSFLQQKQIAVLKHNRNPDLAFHGITSVPEFLLVPLSYTSPFYSWCTRTNAVCNQKSTYSKAQSLNWATSCNLNRFCSDTALQMGDRKRQTPSFTTFPVLRSVL